MQTLLSNRHRVRLCLASPQSWVSASGRFRPFPINVTPSIPPPKPSPIPPQPIPTDRLVNRLPQPVDPADRPMLRQRVPGVEREVVTEQVLFPAIKILSWHNDVGYGSEGRVRLLPFDAGVFDGHVLGRVLALHLEGVAGGGAVDGELLVQGGAEEVGQVLVLLR